MVKTNNGVNPPFDILVNQASGILKFITNFLNIFTLIIPMVLYCIDWRIENRKLV